MYSVGQVIYTVLEEKQLVLPVKVIEEVTIKNLEGEKTNYKVLLPNHKNQKISIDKLDKTFDDAQTASDFLIKNARKAIDEMIFSAMSLEEKFFGIAKNKEEIDACNKDINSVKIDLGDGNVANININELEKASLTQEAIQKKT